MTHIPLTREAFENLTPVQWNTALQGDPAQAQRWLQAAALLGVAEAQAVLGQWLLDGRSGRRDATAAMAWFMKAAAQGHAMGLNMVGRCHENGWGTPVDFFAAANWYRQAARKGLDAAMYNLANLMQTGSGVAQDHVAAVALYRDAADLGHAKSKTKLGRYYEDGLVLDKDEEAAFFCYEEAAKGGDFRGQFSYAGALAARGRMDDALTWLNKVLATATPAYMAQAGALLQQSPVEAFRQVGQLMLDRSAAARAAQSC
ncbi:MAG: tetratricopeptide repeat protein [Ramlibacter sp.]